ncbi:transposase, partial [Bacteroides sp. Ga6A2]|uniref:transposase n=5 Tax=unclassified Bacteroides TaxID=2646097 RepID=UPI00055780A9
KRPIEPEAVFGQMKYNMQYKRFRHFGKGKVTMDFAFFAIAFDIKKMAAVMRKQAQNGLSKAVFIPIYRLYNAKCGFVGACDRFYIKKAAYKESFHAVPVKKQIRGCAYFDTPSFYYKP